MAVAHRLSRPKMLPPSADGHVPGTCFRLPRIRCHRVPGQTTDQHLPYPPLARESGQQTYAWVASLAILIQNGRSQVSGRELPTPPFGSVALRRQSAARPWKHAVIVDHGWFIGILGSSLGGAGGAASRLASSRMSDHQNPLAHQFASSHGRSAERTRSRLRVRRTPSVHGPRQRISVDTRQFISVRSAASRRVMVNPYPRSEFWTTRVGTRKDASISNDVARPSGGVIPAGSDSGMEGRVSALRIHSSAGVLCKILPVDGFRTVALLPSAWVGLYHLVACSIAQPPTDSPAGTCGFASFYVAGIPPSSGAPRSIREL